MHSAHRISLSITHLRIQCRCQSPTDSTVYRPATGICLRVLTGQWTKAGRPVTSTLQAKFLKRSASRAAETFANSRRVPGKAAYAFRWIGKFALENRLVWVCCGSVCGEPFLDGKRLVFRTSKGIVCIYDEKVSVLGVWWNVCLRFLLQKSMRWQVKF